jgi:hypothetical protein
MATSVGLGESFYCKMQIDRSRPFRTAETEHDKGRDARRQGKKQEATATATGRNARSTH